MKRAVCLILCACLCATLFTGCSLLAYTTQPDPEDLLTAIPKPDDDALLLTLAPESSDPEPEIQPALQKDAPISSIVTELDGFYHYSFPQIDCETDDAVAINQEIRDTFGTLIDEGCADAAEGCIPACYYIDYTYHWYKDILVLRVYASYPNDCTYSTVWSLDRLTGTQLTNAEIRALCGVEEADFVEQARAAVYVEFYRGFPEEHWEDVDRSVYDELVAWSQSEEQINLDMQCYPAEDGSLMLISMFASFAGASCYEHIYPYLPTDTPS